jgi:2'-hydroxyisoflavone reductase
VRALILGGTTFLGRHLAQALVRRGHETSLFTRGRTHAAESFALTRYVGERDGGLAALPRRGWDAVIDTSGYVPATVAASCAHLASAGRYLFVSSISVYDASVEALGDGRSPYAPVVPDAADDDPANYGPSKRRSEDVVRAVFGDRALVVRPGLLAGPYDPTNRFTYWADRYAAGGDIAVPGPAERHVQFIDARDAADFIIRLLEDGRFGTYDVTGAKTTMKCFVTTAVETFGVPAKSVWLDERFLEEHGITGWMDLPLWLGPSHDMPGFMNVDIERALADGLVLRPLAETLRDTHAWSQTVAASVASESRAGISRERERELLAARRAAAP